MTEVVGIKPMGSTNIFYVAMPEPRQPYEVGELLVVEIAQKQQVAKVMVAATPAVEGKMPCPQNRILRKADQQDRQTLENHEKKEKEAAFICMEKIKKLNLDMKLVKVEIAFDGRKILFYFTADGRVDFRGLVKELAGIFKKRIELRQIGVRDEAKLLGGLGICGLPFCCGSFLHDFQSVSIKMAKEQGLSLSPSKISGSCGRLMCCLQYEQSTYEAMQREMPRIGSIVKTPDGVGQVTDVVLLSSMVTVLLEGPSNGEVKKYHKDKVEILKTVKCCAKREKP